MRFVQAYNSSQCCIVVVRAMLARARQQISSPRGRLRRALVAVAAVVFGVRQVRASSPKRGQRPEAAQLHRNPQKRARNCARPQHLAATAMRASVRQACRGGTVWGLRART